MFSFVQWEFSPKHPEAFRAASMSGRYFLSCGNLFVKSNFNIILWICFAIFANLPCAFQGRFCMAFPLSSSPEKQLLLLVRLDLERAHQWSSAQGSLQHSMKFLAEAACSVLRSMRLINVLAFVASFLATLRQLIFRYYDPLEGTILIDGVPLKDWDLTHLHRHMVSGSVP